MTHNYAPSKEELIECFKYSDDKEFGATHVDFAIGSRVRVPFNIATNLGLFNGATGTVVEISFEDTARSFKHKLMPNFNKDGSMVTQALRSEGRPQPIISVKMDSTKVSEKLFPHRIVKFGPVQKKLFCKDKKTWYR